MNKTSFPDRQKSPDSDASRWLNGFDEHLFHVQGLAARTRGEYCAGSEALSWSILRARDAGLVLVAQRTSHLFR